MSDERDYTVGSGNVFADLGHPDPDTALAKADIAGQIASIIAARGWNQRQAADVLGLDQPKVSMLLRGQLRDFSLERLMKLLTRLDQDVRGDDDAARSVPFAYPLRPILYPLSRWRRACRGRRAAASCGRGRSRRPG